MTFLCLASLAHAETVSFTTEEYPPFNYRSGDEIVGATVDQISSIMKDVGVDFSIDLMPWARAYRLAQTTPMTCVFATAHKAERGKLFKWVEPLLVDRNILIKHKGSPVSADSLEEAKRYVVGTWREDYTETILHNSGFDKIDVASDFVATLKKLISDRIELMPISELYFEKLRRENQPVEFVAVLSQQPMGIACQKDFPDDLLQKMQTALSKLIADGTQKKIFLKYGLQLPY